jgi:hypothetical protein
MNANEREWKELKGICCFAFISVHPRLFAVKKRRTTNEHE